VWIDRQQLRAIQFLVVIMTHGAESAWRWTDSSRSKPVPVEAFSSPAWQMRSIAAFSAMLKVGISKAMALGRPTIIWRTDRMIGDRRREHRRPAPTRREHGGHQFGKLGARGP
jgi:hypothetical protein